VSIDGQDTKVLHPGESVEVEASPYPIPCINRPSPLGTREQTTSMPGVGQHGVRDPQIHDGWVHDINRLLQFNASFKSISSTHVDTDGHY